jgi:UDP-glucose 4-epimerase
MTTLITGAGIIGCHTARLLAERGVRSILMDRRPALAAIACIIDHPLVCIVQADVTDFEGLMTLARDRDVNQIVHTAALLSTAIRQDPVAGLQVNVMGTAHVLEAARQLKLSRVVIASSTTVGYSTFGDFHGTAFPEDFELRALTHRPGSIYAATKIMGEHLALLYRDLYGTSVAVLRYAAVIGAWSGPGTSVPGKVLSSLLGPARRKETAVLDDPYAMWKGGEEFIDARDCARANVAALDARSPTQGVYHIGLGTLTSFDEFVTTVSQLYPGLKVEFAVQPAGGFAGFAHIREAASDISAAARELAWTPSYSLTDSVRYFAPLLG